MYLNELLIRLLPEDCADEALFDHYRHLMANLPLTDDTEPLLRMFELALLEAMGYGLDLRFESDHGEPVSPGQWFDFRPGDGLIRVGPGDTVSAERHFSGHQLLGIVESRYDDPVVRRGAKRLLRLALQAQLGDRPLYSRELFITSAAQTKRSHAP
jgi:DNA repair protein RecO (recombination protein O)